MEINNIIISIVLCTLTTSCSFSNVTKFNEELVFKEILNKKDKENNFSDNEEFNINTKELSEYRFNDDILKEKANEYKTLNTEYFKYIYCSVEYIDKETCITVKLKRNNKEDKYYRTKEGFINIDYGSDYIDIYQNFSFNEVKLDEKTKKNIGSRNYVFLRINKKERELRFKKENNTAYIIDNR